MLDITAFYIFGSIWREIAKYCDWRINFYWALILLLRQKYCLLKIFRSLSNRMEENIFIKL